LFVIVTSAGDFLTLPLFSPGSFGSIYTVSVAFIVLVGFVDAGDVAMGSWLSNAAVAVFERGWRGRVVVVAASRSLGCVDAVLTAFAGSGGGGQPG
jgi:hypothetical protein